MEAASPNKVKKKKLMEAAAADLKAVGTVATYAGKPLVAGGGRGDFLLNDKIEKNEVIFSDLRGRTIQQF